LLHELLRGLIAQSDGSGWSSLLFPAAIVAVMYFLLLRPQQKAAKDQQNLVATLKKGDEVVTSSGILGKIYAVADKVVTLEVANGVRIRVLKTFIQAKQSSSTDEAEADASAKKDADDKAAPKEGK